MPNPKLEALLRAIIACIGRKTTEPVIQWNEDAAAFSIQVSAHDQGRFVGKKGIVIWALKSIFWYAGLAQITRTVDINLLEPENPDKDRRAVPFRPNAKWDKARITAMIENILSACFNGSITGWSMTEPDHAEAEVSIHLNKYLHTPCSDPDFAEAINVLVHAAGMADGCSITTKVSWQ